MSAPFWAISTTNGPCSVTFSPGRPVRLHRARRGTVRLLFINQIMEYIVR